MLRTWSGISMQGTSRTSLQIRDQFTVKFKQKKHT